MSNISTKEAHQTIAPGSVLKVGRDGFEPPALACEGNLDYFAV